MIYFLVEEPSIAPFKVIPHQGKDQLRAQLPKVVPTLGKVPGARLMVVRIPCQELEAWFLGDLEAVGRAYPRFHPPQLKAKAKYRDVDALATA